MGSEILLEQTDYSAESGFNMEISNPYNIALPHMEEFSSDFCFCFNLWVISTW